MWRPALATLAVFAALTACTGPSPSPAPPSGAAPPDGVSSPAPSGGAPAPGGSGPGGSGPGGSGPGGSGPGGSGPGGSGPGGSGPGGPAGGEPAPPPNRALPTPPRRDCPASVDEATARPGETPGPVCVRVGAVLRITSAPAPERPWQPVTSSDPGVLACESAAGPDGTVEATCRALRPGTAAAATAERGGAAWRLPVTVVG